MTLLETSSTAALTLPDDVLALGLAHVESRDSVQRWTKRGRPQEDIDMEVVNVLRHDMRHVALCRFLEVARERCGTTDAETLRLALSHLAATGPTPKERE